MTDQVLIHHGIKGQRWGIRRFRNADGTLTAAGKNRYYDDKGKLNTEGKRAKADNDNASKAIAGARQVTSGMQRMAVDGQVRNRYNRRENLTQDEIDGMSDDDLRKLVNRINLEQQYSMLTEDKTVGSRVRAGIQSIDTVLSIAGGALSVAAAYKMLRG